MNQIEKLINDVAISRNEYLKLINTLTDKQAQWKPSTDVWNAVEITEHLFWAEHGGILGMWKTMNAIRLGLLSRQTTSTHQNMPIDEVIALTWREKEEVPAVAAPRMGGPISFWAMSLNNLQPLLELFSKELEEQDLRTVAHPHPISGDMDFQQRLEFLSFHIDRHRFQVERLLENIQG